MVPVSLVGRLGLGLLCVACRNNHFLAILRWNDCGVVLWAVFVVWCRDSVCCRFRKIGGCVVNNSELERLQDEKAMLKRVME